MQQHTVADAVYLVEHLTVGLCYAQRTAEAAGTLNLKLHVVQQQVVVVLVAGLFAGIARTAHTGSTVQRLNLQAGIIGDAGLAQLLCIIGSLWRALAAKVRPVSAGASTASKSARYLISIGKSFIKDLNSSTLP